MYDCPVPALMIVRVRPARRSEALAGSSPSKRRGMRVALTAPYRPTRIGHEGQLDLRTAIGGKRMFNYNQAYWNTLEPIEKLEEEIRLISPQLVAQTWGGPLHGLPYTLSGYMMVCFSHIDLVSCYFEAPPRSRGQTPRMVAFMTQYIARDREANRV